MSHSRETWKEIKGYEGLYKVSSHGRILSLRYRHSRQSCILKPLSCGLISSPEGNRYLHVHLWKNKKKHDFSVHRIVAENFIENHDFLREVNHKDFNPSNNHIDNLEWVSREQNMRHAATNERHAKKLNRLKVIFIRENFYKGTISKNELAKKFGVNWRCIHRVIRKERWAHIE